MIQREDIVAQIKEQADIVQIIGESVDLKKSGARYLGLCPFHGEKTPSFSVHPGQQFFYCFGCGESGDVLSYVMKHQNVDFPGALEILAQKYNITLPATRMSKEDEERKKKQRLLFDVNEKACTIYNKYLLEHKDGKLAREYLKQRGISEKVLTSYRLGYAPAVEAAGWNYLGSKFRPEEQIAAVEAGLLVKKEKGGHYDRFRDRIVFPIFDISGQVCGFGGRIVGEGQPKYLNSPESPVYNKSRLLLGLYQQKEQIRKQNRAVMVEGNFDLLSLVVNGCENVVAPLGTALTREQLRLIKRFTEEVTLLFDGDEAGIKAAIRAVPLFLTEKISGRVALLPDQHDPDTFIREHGTLELTRIIESAEELPEFLLGYLIKEHGLGFDGKRKIVDELIPLVEAAKSPLQRSVFISHFANKLGMSAELLEKDLQQSLKTPRVDAIAENRANKAAVPNRNSRETVKVPLTIPQKQLLEYMILNPGHFDKLEENNLRQFLVGTIGEILFLEQKRLLAENSLAEPEELLTQLPDGMERSFVANLLLDSSNSAQLQGSTEKSGELENQIQYLRNCQLKQSAKSLLKKIEQAQKQGDQVLLMQLMEEQLELNRKLHEEELEG